MNKLSTNTNPELIPPPHLQTNDRLGRFILGRRINDGLIFHAWQGHDPLRNSHVCLEIANSSCQPGRIFLEDKFRIANMFAAYENIIDVYDIHQIEYGPAELTVLSTEYSPGGSLADWIEVNRNNIDLRRQEGRRFIAELVNVLDLIQYKGLFLPDFNPVNFVLVDGQLKLANLINPENYLLSHQAGDNFADPRYKAPECFIATESSELSMASSIYSFGILACEILSENARPPFEGSYEQVKDKHLFLEPPVPAIEPSLGQALRRCLSKSSVKRPQDADETKEALLGGSNSIVSADENELESLCGKLVDAMNIGDVQQSCLLCREAFDLAPGRGDLLELKRQLEPVANRIDRCIEDLKMNMDRQDIDYSLEMLNQAVKLNGGPTEEMKNIAVILEQRFTECHRYAQYGLSAVAQKNFSLALDYFERAWQMNCCDAALANWRTVLSDIVEAKCGMEMSMQNDSQAAALYFAEKLDALIGRIGPDESE